MEIKKLRRVRKVKSNTIPDSKIREGEPKIIEYIEPPEGDWQYFNGRLLIDGQDLAFVFEDQNKPTSFWTELSAKLNSFKRYYLERKIAVSPLKDTHAKDYDEIDPGGELTHVMGLVEKYQTQIMQKLSRDFQTKANSRGLSIDSNQQLLLNGMNVTSLVYQAIHRQDQQSQVLLVGLKKRLNLLLAAKQTHADYEILAKHVVQIINQIDQALIDLQ